MHVIRFTTNHSQPVWLKFIFLLFLSYPLCTARMYAQAPVTVTIGAAGGTGSATNGPIWTGSSGSLTKYSRYAFLYTGGVGGDLATIPSGSRIVKVAWLRGTGGTIAASNTMNVWLSNTTASSLTNLTPWSTLVNGATQTFSSTNYAITGASGTYIEAQFNVPGNDTFTYTGGNLQILTDWFRGGAQTGVAINFVRNAATGKAIGANGAAALTGATTLTNTNSLGDFRPTLQITYIPVAACSGTPNTGNALCSAASACVGTPFTLSIQNIIAGSGISYVWQRADDIGFTSGVATLGTSSTVNTTETASSYYRCIATCSGSGLSFTSPPVFVPLSPSYQCFCSSTATSAADEEIYNFSFGSLSNSSDCNTFSSGAGSVAQLYSNYQYLTPPNVERLSTVPFSIQVGTCLNQYPNRSAIFIDYNHSGVFDANELVYSSSQAITGAHTEAGNIVIPASAVLGLTGLRVITSEQAAPISSACGTYSWGETEDYIINITPTTICSGAPVPGNTMASSSTVCSGKTVNLSVQNLTTGVGVSYQWYTSTGIIAGATANVYVSAPIFNPTTFYCAVTCANSGLTTNSTPVTITMSSFIDCYCVSQAGADADDDIFSFKFNNVIHATNCTTPAPGPGSILGRYSNFYPLGNIATLDLGYSVPFDIEADDCDQAPYYSFSSAIWIDFNQNGSFNDPGEKVFVESVSLEGPRHIIGNITIPCTAKVGQTAMRVTIAEGLSGFNLTPCLLYGFGETEDYKILLKYPDTCSVVSNPPGNTLGTVTSFCDSAASVLSLQNKCMFDNFSYQWYQGNYPGTIIPGATTKTYATPMLTATTTFYCSVSCGSSTVISTPITIPKVVLHPTTIASAGGSYCVGGTPISLTTTHTYTGVPTPTTYAYAPATGLSANSGSIVSASPTVNTVYTVTATDINGCFGTTTVAVSTTHLLVDLVASSSSYCAPNGAPVTLTSTGGISYIYTPAAGLSSDTGSAVTASPTSTTQYIVTGVDSTGCYGMDSVVITVGSLTWYLDVDGDGYYVGTPVISCVSPGIGYTTTILASGDCNDNVFSIHPGAAEICGNGIDENCNGQIDEGCCIPNTGSSSLTVCNSYTWVENSNTVYTNSGVYMHTFTNVAGCDSVHSLHLTVNQCNSILDLHLYLQGYYIGSGLMTPVLLNEGSGISAIEADTITVELRDEINFSVVATTNTMLYTDGTASCIFPALNGSYYIVVNHRNGVQTWSASPVAIGALPVSYDFATAANKAYGDNMNEVESGVWAFFSGDINQDENVDLIDLGILEADINDFQFGYIASDVNGDGNVDLLDSPMVEQNINDFIYSSHP